MIFLRQLLIINAQQLILPNNIVTSKTKCIYHRESNRIIETLSALDPLSKLMLS